MLDYFVIGMIIGVTLVTLYRVAAQLRRRYVWALSYKTDIPFMFGLRCWLKYDTPLEPFLTEWKVEP